MTLKRIYESMKYYNLNYNVFATIEEASKAGYSVEEIRDYLLSRGYNREYLDEMIEAMRKKSIIPPWD